MESIKGKIVKTETVDRTSAKRLMNILYLKYMKLTVDCPKCGNLAEKIPLKRLARDLRDYLTELNVFHCFAYWCKYCEESDIEIPSYF